MHSIKLFCHPCFKAVWGEMEQARAHDMHAVCNLNTVLQMYLLYWLFWGGFSGQHSLCLTCYMLASS